MILRRVIIPLLFPALLSGFLLAFLLSFDDFLITFYTNGVGSDTLPIRLYAAMKIGLSPKLSGARITHVFVFAFAHFFDDESSRQQGLRRLNFGVIVNTNLKGRWAFITGASSGFGTAIAEQLAAAGVNVVLCARRVERLDAIATDLKARFGIEAVSLVFDIFKT